MLTGLGVRLIFVCMKPAGKGSVCDLMEGQDPSESPSWEAEPSSILGRTNVEWTQGEGSVCSVVNTKAYLLFCLFSWFAPNCLKCRKRDKHVQHLSHLQFVQTSASACTPTHPHWSPWLVSLQCNTIILNLLWAKGANRTGPERHKTQNRSSFLEVWPTRMRSCSSDALIQNSLMGGCNLQTSSTFQRWDGVRSIWPITNMGKLSLQTRAKEWRRIQAEDSTAGQLIRLSWPLSLEQE